MVQKPLRQNGISFSSTTRTVEGILCSVGTDFIDVLQDDCTVITVLSYNIKKIIWPEKDCNPCDLSWQEDFCCACNCDCKRGRIHHPGKRHHHKHHHACDSHIHHHQRGHKDCECDCDFYRHDCDYELNDCHFSSFIPVCDGRVQLRLGGLTRNLNFHLFNQKGCKVIIECAS